MSQAIVRPLGTISRPGISAEAVVTPVGPGYALLTMDESDPESPIHSDDVPALIAYADHDAQGVVSVDNALQPLSVMGTRTDDGHVLNQALKTPSGQVYCGCGDARFNSVTEWEHALRQALRGRAGR